MTRREAVVAGAAGVVSALAPQRVTEAVKLMPIYVREGNVWRQCRMYELPIGSVFKIGEEWHDKRVAGRMYRVASAPTVTHEPFNDGPGGAPSRGDAFRTWEVYAAPLWGE